jgi:hypothetical protein
VNKYYLIEENELIGLLCDVNKYWALESKGVDNWADYNASLKNYLEELHCMTFTELAHKDLKLLIKNNSNLIKEYKGD